MRRGSPELIFAALIALLLGSILWYTHHVVGDFYTIRVRGNVARERIWAGMARESAHQLGTPLSSLGGWIELLEERAGDPSTQAAAGHMRADLERLDRVAHRFERIGREPK